MFSYRSLFPFFFMPNCRNRSVGVGRRQPTKHTLSEFVGNIWIVESVDSEVRFARSVAIVARISCSTAGDVRGVCASGLCFMRLRHRDVWFY